MGFSWRQMRGYELPVVVAAGDLDWQWGVTDEVMFKTFMDATCNIAAVLNEDLRTGEVQDRTVTVVGCWREFRISKTTPVFDAGDGKENVMPEVERMIRATQRLIVAELNGLLKERDES